MSSFKLVLLLLPSTAQGVALAFSQHSVAARTLSCKPQNGPQSSYCNHHLIGVALATRGGDGGDQLDPLCQVVDNHVQGNLVAKSQRPKSSDAASYYLLWSPTMRAKAIFSLMFLGILHVVAGSFLSTMAKRPPTTGLVPSFVSNVFLPLLSSACCSIQLIINAVASAGGCSGFNSYLGPLRPYFFSFLVYLAIISRSSLSLKSWLIETCFRFSLALLPELVHVWNNLLTRRWTEKNRPLIALIAQRQPDAQLLEVLIELDIPGMGCVACINKIDASIRTAAEQQIISSESWLDPERAKGGNSSIRLSVSSLEEANAIAESIVQKVKGAGFDICRVQSIGVGNAVKEVLL